MLLSFFLWMLVSVLSRLFSVATVCDGLIFHQQEIEDFVQSSGEHGVVVFSLGSMVGTLTEERANVIAAGLAQIPQKVRNCASVWHPH